jgi:hypothetical protein
MQDAQQVLVKVQQLQSQASSLGSTANCSITVFMLSTNANTSTLAIAGSVGIITLQPLSLMLLGVVLLPITPKIAIR